MPACLNRYGAKDLLPVAACLGLGADNELYNINADHMAAACAEYLDADQLIYLTDVAGVLDGDKVLSAIACEEIERLVQARVVSGGMVSEAGSGEARDRRRRARSADRGRQLGRFGAAVPPAPRRISRPSRHQLRGHSRAARAAVVAKSAVTVA